MAGLVTMPTAPVSRSQGQGMRGRRIVRPRGAGAIGFGLLGAIVLMAFIGPLVLPEDNPTDVTAVYAPPSWDHPLGTDWRGQDVLHQIVNGGASLIVVSSLAAAIATTIAVAGGGLAALVGGRLDSGVLVLADVALTIPFIILLGVLAVYVKLDNVLMLSAVLAAFGWPTLLRAVRAQALSLKAQPYVDAARMLGTPLWRVLARAVLPNMMPYIVISFVLGMTHAIYGQVILYYLGLVPLQGDNWGLMIQQIQATQAYALDDAFVYVLAPIAMISLLQLSLILIARNLEDVFDPRLRTV